MCRHHPSRARAPFWFFPLLLLVLVVLALAVAASPVAAAPPAGKPGPTPTPTPVPAPGNQGLQAGQPMGDDGAIYFTDATAGQIAAAGAGWVRINFRLGNAANWTDLAYVSNGQPASAMSQYDKIIASARSHNLQVIGLLSNEAWHGVQSDWQANSAESAGGNGDNTYIDQFAASAAGVLIPHYAGQIAQWEVWNEPNAQATYIYPSNFAWLLNRVYVAARNSGVTGLTLVSGGLYSSNSQNSQTLTTANTGADYLTSTYSQGQQHANWGSLRTQYGTYPLDAIGQHLYIDQWGTTRTSRVQQAVSLVHNAYVNAEGGLTTKQTHVTEMGWTTALVSEITQSSNLTTAYTELKSLSYIARTYWFFLQDVPTAGLYHGLLRSDGSQKPSWGAYQQIH